MRVNNPHLSLERVLIYAHPHSGGSLLKAMLTCCKGTDHILEEAESVKRTTPGVTTIAKWPLWTSKTVEPDGHTFVFLAREPEQALWSLRRRFPGEVPPDHQVLFTTAYWHSFFDRWLAASASTKDAALRYQDMFDETRFTSLCAFLGRKPVNPYGTYVRKIFDSEIPRDRPDPQDHARYRQYQLNLQIRNMDDPSRVYEDQGFIREIRSHASYHLIFGDKQ